MKIFIACSKHFYRIQEIKKQLESKGHKISLPNSYNKSFEEEKKGIKNYIGGLE